MKLLIGTLAALLVLPACALCALLVSLGELLVARLYHYREADLSRAFLVALYALVSPADASRCMPIAALMPRVYSALLRASFGMRQLAFRALDGPEGLGRVTLWHELRRALYAYTSVDAPAAATRPLDVLLGAGFLAPTPDERTEDIVLVDSRAVLRARALVESPRAHVPYTYAPSTPPLAEGALAGALALTLAGMGVTAQSYAGRRLCMRNNSTTACGVASLEELESTLRSLRYLVDTYGFARGELVLPFTHRVERAHNLYTNALSTLAGRDVSLAAAGTRDVALARARTLCAPLRLHVRTTTPANTLVELLIIDTQAPPSPTPVETPAEPTPTPVVVADAATAVSEAAPALEAAAATTAGAVQP